MIEIYIEMIQQTWLDLQQGLLPDLGGWNYILMAVLIMFQGRASAVIGGIAAATGYLNLGVIILVAMLARMIVDLFWYKVGTTGIIDRLGRHAAPYRTYSERINDGIQRRPTKLVLLSKTVGGLSVPLTIAVGNARVPLRRWLPASFLGELLWIVLLSKTVGGLSVPLTIAVGNARVPLRRWLPASFLGELLWILPLLLVGFFATDMLSDIKGGLIYLTAGSIVLMLVFTLIRKAKSKFAAANNSS
jgi:membrane protein DedA with SNARE-associated domain